MDRDYYEDIVDQVDDRQGGNWYRLLTSILVYFFSYNLMFILGGMFMALVASWVGFEPQYKYMGVYNLPTKTQDWHRWLVLAVYGAIPFFGLVFGLIVYWINMLLWEYNTIVKVFMLWMSVHAFTFFGGYAIASVVGTGDYGSPFYYGFATAASWFHLEKPFMVPFTLMGILFMIGCGILFIRGFLNLSYSRKVAINYQRRRSLLRQVLIGPWLIGAILCIGVVLMLRPDNYDFNRIKVMMPHLVHHGSILLLIIGTIFRLDYIVGGIVVHSFDVFKGRIWAGAVGLVVVSVAIFLLSRYPIYF